ncbi:MAG: fimbrillin family protein, partial [Alistipes sp.]|nr:fimbrillin family protein [Alistipes sp.]
LINDTLAYGKAASEYKKHDTMTGDYTVSDSTIPDATVTLGGAFTGYTVVFGQVNFIKVSVELADGYTLYLDGTDITTQLVGGIFKTDGIAPTEFDKKFSFEIKNGDTIVQTFAVSVNDYIGAQKDSATMGNLVKALYNYGVSAEIYNHVANGVGEHTYTYIDNGDGTHDKVCTVCGDVVADNENHTIENHVCTACGAMEIVVSFDSDDYEWKTGDTLYFCRVSRNNQWEEYCFTATVAEDGTVTWTSDKTLYWDGTGEHRLFVSYPCTAVGWDDFMIPTDQSDVDKLKEADCMNARWIGTPTTNVIEFELKHRMAKITVNYVIASQFDLDAPIIAEIYSNAMYCIFRDADGLPIITSVGQYDAWITPYHNANQFTVYVAPGEYNTDGMFKFYVGDAEVQIEITTPGAVTLEEGGEYTFDVKVGQDVFRIAEVSMGDIDSPFGDGWNSETDLKAIGTQAEGKTAWENGDQIIVIFTSPRFGTQYGTLTYDGNVGSWSTDVSFSYLEGEIPTVSAIYAPCYEVVDGNMQLKDGMQLGMTEYISAACSITDETLNISFKGATRNYSRLRIVGLANQTLTVITTGFTPAGATEEASESYTLTTDEDGNADIYGTFAEGATILVQLDETELAQYIFYESTANGMSYALDALSAQE